MRWPLLRCWTALASGAPDKTICVSSAMRHCWRACQARARFLSPSPVQVRAETWSESCAWPGTETVAILLVHNAGERRDARGCSPRKRAGSSVYLTSTLPGQVRAAIGRPAAHAKIGDWCPFVLVPAPPPPRAGTTTITCRPPFVVHSLPVRSCAKQWPLRRSLVRTQRTSWSANEPMIEPKSSKGTRERGEQMWVHLLLY